MSKLRCTLSACPLGVLLVLVVACDSWPAQHKASVPERVAVAIARAEIPPLCESGLNTLQVTLKAHAVTALVANGTLCLSCRNVGLFARQARFATGGVPLNPLVILAPLQDSATICEYLSRERVTAPVFGLQNLPPRLDSLYLIRLTSDGRVGLLSTDLHADRFLATPDSM